MNKYMTDVVVIGGGIIGSSIAYYLSKSGKKVIVLEKKGISSGTSSSCDGFMFFQTKKPGSSLEIALKSAEIYASLSEELEYDVHFKQNGGLILIETEEQLVIMQKIVEKQRELGLDVAIIDGDETRKLEPVVSDKILGAAYSPIDGQINPISVTLGYIQAAKKLGAKVWQESPVIDISVKDKKIDTIITANCKIKTDWVVNACGVWAADIGKMLNLEIPIIPRRGQILVTEPVAPMFKHVMLCARYIAIKHNPDLVRGSNDPGLALGVGFGVEQTENGNLLISNSRDFAGFDTTTTAAVLKEIAKYAVRFIPSLKDLDIIRTYSGLRPFTPDGLPIIGEVDGIKGFVMAAGHEGDGIALAPITGTMVSELIVKGDSTIPLDAFNLRRFIKGAS